jgi:hypothetical protein
VESPRDSLDGRSSWLERFRLLRRIHPSCTGLNQHVAPMNLSSSRLLFRFPFAVPIVQIGSNPEALIADNGRDTTPIALGSRCPSLKRIAYCAELGVGASP